MAAPEAEGFTQLLDGFRAHLLVMQDALLHVAIEHQQAGAFEAGAGSKKLGEDFLAGALFLQHFAKAAHLAFYAGKAVQQLFWSLAHHATSIALTYPEGVRCNEPSTVRDCVANGQCTFETDTRSHPWPNPEK